MEKTTTSQPYYIFTKISKCTACGKEHKDIQYTKEEWDTGAVRFTYLCPNKNILVAEFSRKIEPPIACNSLSDMRREIQELRQTLTDLRKEFDEEKHRALDDLHYH
jgi:hypothetical protein